MTGFELVVVVFSGLLVISVISFLLEILSASCAGRRGNCTPWMYFLLTFLLVAVNIISLPFTLVVLIWTFVVIIILVFLEVIQMLILFIFLSPLGLIFIPFVFLPIFYLLQVPWFSSVKWDACTSNCSRNPLTSCVYKTFQEF